MNRKRKATVWKSGGSSVVAVPPDWLEGEDVRPGDEVAILYDGIVVIAAKGREARARAVLNRMEAGP